MRVAVTGASGFVGGEAVRALAGAGHSVVALSRREVSGVEWHRWDLAEPAPRLPRVDAVVHAAAHVSDWDPWPRHRRITVDGTARVLAAFPGARMVLVSSCSVYPLRAPGQRFPETVPVSRRPLSPYVRAKVEQEALAPPDALILRPHAVYGPGDTTLLPRLSETRRRGRMVIPSSPGTLIHLTDVATLSRAIVAAVERPHVAGIVNVADATPLTAREVVAGLREANGWVERPLWLGAPTAWGAALAMEVAARLLRSPSPPLLTRYSASHVACSRTFVTERLRVELGVEPSPSDLSRWHPGRPRFQ